MAEEQQQKHHHGWELFDSASVSEDCDGSVFSSCSDLTEDDASSSSSSSPFSSFASLDGPLYEMSSLLAGLPIKRGLSRFFEGKSQSFTSLYEARSIEELAKKERTKSWKSCGGRVEKHNKTCFAPNTGSRIISKKVPRSHCSSLPSRNRSSGVF